MYDSITPITRYKIAILRPYYADYACDTWYRIVPPRIKRSTRGPTASRLQGNHICVINTKGPYFHSEFAMYDRITPITQYKIAIARPYYVNHVVQIVPPRMKRSIGGPFLTYRGTTFVL